jgi:hypothetical protein
MQKFTPGPWRTIDGDSVVNVVGPEGQPIAATTSKAYYERHDAEDKANARLISAAPEMCDALRAVCGVYEGHEDVPLFVRKARAALAKATGA